MLSVSSVFPRRSVLHPGSGLLWILCQQGQDARLQRHQRTSVERSQSSRILICTFVSPLLQHVVLCINVIFLKEFEIELEGSQYLRILCYEKCFDKSMLNKDDNEIVDKIMGKGQVQVRRQLLPGIAGRRDVYALSWGLFPACDSF